MAVNTVSLWRNREYVKLFSSYTIGNIGDWFDFFALQIIFAHYFNASPMALSLLLVAYMAPMALFGAFAGVMADRFNKKRLLILTDFISGVMTLGLIFSHFIILSVILVFVRSSVASLNSPAQQVALKYTVSAEQLLAATSYNSVVFQLCKVIGPFLGALIIAWYAPVWCLVIHAMSFFVSVLILLGFKNIVEVKSDETEVHTHYWQQFKEGWHIIQKSVILKTVLTMSLILFIFLMMGFGQMVLLLKHLFPNDASLLGVLMGVSGVGSLITGAWMSQKKDIKNYAAYFAIGFLLIALNYVMLGLYDAEWGIYFLYVLSLLDGLGFGIAVVLYSYILQKETMHGHMGRVSGLSSMLQGIVFVLGSFLGGVVVEFFGLREMFVLCGCGCLLVVGFVILRWRVLQVQVAVSS